MSDPSSAMIPFDSEPPPPPPQAAVSAAAGASSGFAREYNKGNWTVQETLTLITAKRLDDERRARGERSSSSSGDPGQRPAEQRWKWVENYCWRSGCLRSQNQCNDKWDNLLRDYKKVRAYETRAASEDPDASGNRPSYWSMDRQERKERNLPTNLSAEVHAALTDVLRLRSSRRSSSTAAIPITSHPLPLPLPLPLLPEHHKVELDAPPLPPPPPPPPPPEHQHQHQHQHPHPPPQPSVSVEDASESDEDGDDGDSDGEKRRKARRVGSSVARGATALARALLACEEKRERRHRDVMELEERRLRADAERTEMGRQGIAGLIAAVGGLSGAIHALASSSHNQHHRRHHHDSQ